MPGPSGKRRFSLCNDSMKHKKTFPRRKGPPPARRPLRSAPAGPTEWDQAARWYSTVVGDQGSDYQRSLIFPGAFRMLAVKKGDRVLDLAWMPRSSSSVTLPPVRRPPSAFITPMRANRGPSVTPSSTPLPV